MPQRRSHTKSRDGCNRCKKRRIKCDESGPPCATCRARNAVCEYPSNIFRPSSWTERYKEKDVSSEKRHIIHTAPETELSSESVQENSNTPLFSIAKRTRELQLMHHWTLKTCHSFSKILSDVFQTYVVEQALHYHFLMDALLALTSLHMASELAVDSPERAVFLSDALQYQSRALPAFRMELENVSPINCDALFACSVLMMACTVVSPWLEIQDSEPDISAKVPTHLKSLFHFVKGIHSIIDQARPSLDSGPFEFIIQPYSGVDPTFLSAEEGVLPPVLRKLCCGMNAPSQEIYEHAVDTLEHCAIAKGMVIPWIVMAGGEFVEKVESEEPLALLIYICWGALLGRLEEVWWARMAGKMIVRNLVGHIVSRNEEWDGVVKWAKDLVRMETK